MIAERRVVELSFCRGARERIKPRSGMCRCRRSWRTREAILSRARGDALVEAIQQAGQQPAVALGNLAERGEGAALGGGGDRAEGFAAGGGERELDSPRVLIATGADHQTLFGQSADDL